MFSKIVQNFRLTTGTLLGLLFPQVAYPWGSGHDDISREIFSRILSTLLFGSQRSRTSQRTCPLAIMIRWFIPLPIAGAIGGYGPTETLSWESEQGQIAGTVEDE